jgi:hypothetical protein
MVRALQALEFAPIRLLRKLVHRETVGRPRECDDTVADFIKERG